MNVAHRGVCCIPALSAVRGTTVVRNGWLRETLYDAGKHVLVDDFGRQLLDIFCIIPQDGNT